MTDIKRGPIVPVSLSLLEDAHQRSFEAWLSQSPPTRRTRLRWWLDEQADRFHAAWRAFRDPHGWS